MSRSNKDHVIAATPSNDIHVSDVDDENKFPITNAENPGVRV